MRPLRRLYFNTLQPLSKTRTVDREYHALQQPNQERVLQLYTHKRKKGFRFDLVFSGYIPLSSKEWCCPFYPTQPLHYSRTEVEESLISTYFCFSLETSVIENGTFIPVPSSSNVSTKHPLPNTNKLKESCASTQTTSLNPRQR